MDIEKIEKILSSLDQMLEEEDKRVATYYLLPVLECHLLLHIYKKLESMDDSLIAPPTDTEKKWYGG